VLAAVSGAVVMAVELLGARMLSVVFGGSVLVWAAMISVTLLSLTAGYFVGGRVADRWPRAVILCSVILVAAMLTSVCPHARFVLDWSSRTLGLQGGALASSLVVFFLPLGLMGISGPFIIRLLAQGHGIGRTAGAVYAISTLGSVAGTLLTGLWLIPSFGVAWGFRFAACALAAVAVVGLVLSRPRLGAAGALLAAGVTFMPMPGPAIGAAYIAPDGDQVTVLDVQESAYGHLVVLRKGTYHLLVADGIVQSGVPRTIAQMPKAAALAQRYFQELLPYTVEDAAGRSVLIIGLAGGMTATLLRQYEMEIEAVDLDPAVIALARRHFGFVGQAVAADGRRFLQACTQRYDFCVIDTYAGDVFPFHLSTVEAFRAARSVLNPEGILTVNFIGSPAGQAFACVCRTLGAVFPHLLAIRGEDGNDVQTITIFAASRPVEFNHGWLRWLGAFRGVDPIADTIRRLRVDPLPAGGFVLTDELQPD